MIRFARHRAGRASETPVKVEEEPVVANLALVEKLVHCSHERGVGIAIRLEPQTPEPSRGDLGLHDRLEVRECRLDRELRIERAERLCEADEVPKHRSGLFAVRIEARVVEIRGGEVEVVGREKTVGAVVERLSPVMFMLSELSTPWTKPAAMRLDTKTALARVTAERKRATRSGPSARAG